MLRKYIVFVLGITLISCTSLFSQVKGESQPSFNPDTVFVFQPTEALLTYQQQKDKFTNSWGIQAHVLETGFGFGAFFQQYVYKDFISYIDFYISGAKNTDEIEFYDRDKRDYRVLNKVNRLYYVPIQLGVQQFFFQNILTDGFRPFLTGGLGPSIIFSTPYDKDWFEAWSYSKTYVRFGGFVGLGAELSSGATLLSINLKYYYIPFGGDGLESVKDRPIKVFGGASLSFHIGFKF